MPDGKVVTRAGEVAAMMEKDVIGVNAEQFSQIVMIAQGEFRKLIQAKTSDRKEILRQIFKTAPYERLTALLGEACKAKFEAYNDAQQRDSDCDEKSAHGRGRRVGRTAGKHSEYESGRSAYRGGAGTG